MSASVKSSAPKPQGTRFPPPAAAPTAIVLHDVAEVREHRRAQQEAHSPTLHTTIAGIRCMIRKDNSEVVAVWAPPFSALTYKYRGCGGEAAIAASGFVADHYFQRREVRDDEEAASGEVVKHVLNMCGGCVAKGWHLPETDITSHVYGVEMPDWDKPYPPPDHEPVAETRDE